MQDKLNHINKLLNTVCDPEIPVLTILDMGIVRKIAVHENKVNIDITPTYSGCPAMDMISMQIRQVLENADYDVDIKMVLSPAWTTDWLSKEGRNKLKEYGIAPPLEASKNKLALLGIDNVLECTHCGSTNTKMISEFGSTACKSLFQCKDCLEPFDYFKCLT